MTKNERLTENIVRGELRRLGYNRPANKITIEEQKSQIEAVKRLMRAASKSGGGGSGSPEFIISAASTPDFLLIVECKASQNDHISKVCKTLLDGKSIDETDEAYAVRVKRFAADGVLHYAKYLSREFNVIAVAVSGEATDSSLVTTYLHAKGSHGPKVLVAKDGADIDSLIPWAS